MGDTFDYKPLTDEELEQIGSVDIDYIVKMAEGFCDEKTIDILRQYERLVARLLITTKADRARIAELKKELADTVPMWEKHKAERDTLRTKLETSERVELRHYETIKARDKRIVKLEDQAADDRTWLVERNKARAERDTLVGDLAALCELLPAGVDAPLSAYDGIVSIKAERDTFRDDLAEAVELMRRYKGNVAAKPYGLYTEISAFLAKHGGSDD